MPHIPREYWHDSFLNLKNVVFPGNVMNEEYEYSRGKWLFPLSDSCGRLTALLRTKVPHDWVATARMWSTAQRRSKPVGNPWIVWNLDFQIRVSNSSQRTKVLVVLINSTSAKAGSSAVDSLIVITEQAPENHFKLGRLTHFETGVNASNRFLNVGQQNCVKRKTSVNHVIM